MSKRIALLVIALTLCGGKFAGLTMSQTLAPKRTPSSSSGPDRAKPETAEDEAALETQRQNRLSRLQSFSDRVTEFKDLRIKVRALLGLADLTWKEDEQRARGLSLKTYDLVKAASPTETNDTPSGVALADLMSLRRSVIAFIARHDQALARRLTRAEIGLDFYKNHPGERRQLYLDSAFSLVDSDYRAAVNLVADSLQYGISGRLIWFLNSLKQQDEGAADSLFTLILQSLATQPTISINDFLFLGTFIFTSPATDLAVFGDSVVVMVGVGGVAVANISGNRASASPQLIREYVDAAVVILAKASVDPKQRPLAYLAAYQIYGKALESAPERAPEIASLLSMLAPDVPPRVKDPSALAVFSRPRLGVGTVDEEMAEIDGISNPEAVTAKSLSVASEFFVRGDLIAARRISQKIPDIGIREQVVRVIEFGEISGLIERGELLDAQMRIAKLGSCTESAVLWLGLGQAFAKGTNRQMALESINEGLKDARRLTGTDRECLMYTAAGLAAPLDSLFAQQTLGETVRAFNGEDSVPEDYAVITRVIEAGPVRRKFSLKIKGLDFAFASAVRPLANNDDTDSIAYIVSGLKSERVLADGLLAVASSIVKKEARNR